MSDSDWIFPREENCSILSFNLSGDGTYSYVEACVVDEDEVEISRTMVDLKTGDISTIPTKPEEVKIL